MKFICSKEKIIKALSIAESVISTKNSISILSNVLIEADNDKIKISASESRLNFFTEFNANVLEKGAASVYSNKLYLIIRKLPGDDIEISVDNNFQFLIKPIGKANIKYTLKGIDSEKFPPIKLLENTTFFSIPQDIFIDMTKKTIFAISMSESRRFVSGIFFEKINDEIRMVSTDGKRLALIKRKIGITPEIGSGIIIPPKILHETLKLSTGNGDVKIAIDNKSICISIDDFFFISNLLEGNFPPYEKVIPEGDFLSLSIIRNDLLMTLDRISQIGDKESHKVILSFYKDTLEIFSEDIVHGTGNEQITIDYQGEDIKIALNCQFIIDALNVIKSDNIILEFKDPQSTVMIKEENNNNYLYIMMPMSF